MRAEHLSLARPHWVISDTHFGHGNILQYCPWRMTWAATIEEHDRAIIEAWRATVGHDDIVLHLGDFSLGERIRIGEVRRMLPGRICIVRGNHDRSITAMKEAGFDWVCNSVRVSIGSEQCIGKHNPADFTLQEASVNTRLLHGHCHGNGYQEKIETDVKTKARDCSLDAIKSIAPVAWSSLC